MKYEVVWDTVAHHDFSRLPDKESLRIIAKVENYLVQNPRFLGIALTGTFSGLYRYRVGDYRIIYEIFEAQLRICVVRVGHRKDIYE